MLRSVPAYWFSPFSWWSAADPGEQCAAYTLPFRVGIFLCQQSICGYTPVIKGVCM